MIRMPRRAAMAGAAALCIVVAGCASQGAPSQGATPTVVDSVTFAPDLAVDLATFTKTPSGLRYFDLVKGDKGLIATESRRVTIKYVVFLPDGTVVDGQREPPMEAEIGTSMMRGLRQGLIGMRAGGQRRLVIPPSLAYGRSQFGRIPPNSTLVMDVELLAVR
jgi:FKBP-type peptidyl-prolyl cis-trans isomerase